MYALPPGRQALQHKVARILGDADVVPRSNVDFVLEPPATVEMPYILIDRAHAATLGDKRHCPALDLAGIVAPSPFSAVTMLAGS